MANVERIYGEMAKNLYYLIMEKDNDIYVLDLKDIWYYDKDLDIHPKIIFCSNNRIKTEEFEANIKRLEMTKYELYGILCENFPTNAFKSNCMGIVQATKYDLNSLIDKLNIYECKANNDPIVCKIRSHSEDIWKLNDKSSYIQLIENNKCVPVLDSNIKILFDIFNILYQYDNLD